MHQLNRRLSVIHDQALRESGNLRVSQKNLVEILMKVEENKIHKILGQASMFLYATKLLKLDESVAYALITVARKSKTLPALRKAIAMERVSPSKANRMVAHMDESNAEELIEFASQHTSSEIDFEMARRNPKGQARDKVKPLSEDQVQLTLTVDQETFALLKRVQSLLAQKNKPSGFSESVSEAIKHYVNTQDPVRKAERYAKRKENKPSQSKELRLNRVQKVTIRKPRTAAEDHEVALKDQGRCTHLDSEGKRCNNDRWVHTHHIIRVAQGGTNHPKNLTTLCSFHHDLVHQSLSG